MRKYLPHLSFLFLIIIFAVFTFTHVFPYGVRNYTAGFMGAVVGLLTDPLLAIGAIMIGVSCIKQRYLLISSLLFAIIISIVIAQMNADLGESLTLYIIFARLVAILTIAYLVNAFRILVFQPMPGEEPSRVSDKSFQPISEKEPTHTSDKSSEILNTEELRSIKTKVRSEAEHQISPDEIFRMIPRDEIIKAARWLARSEILKDQGKIEESLHFGQKALNVCLWYKISLDKIRPEAALQRVQLEKEDIEEACIKAENRWKFSDSKFAKQFISPEQWRLFLVLQVVGLVFAVFIDATSRLDLFPEHRYGWYRWNWDLFTARHYAKSAPWFFLLGIFGPFVSIKTFNWIRGAKVGGKMENRRHDDQGPQAGSDPKESFIEHPVIKFILVLGTALVAAGSAAWVVAWLFGNI